MTPNGGEGSLGIDGEPLAGLRVCDLSQNLAGPYCTQILADLGADVVKVEPPGGDPARHWGPPFWNGESTLYLSANRGKRSVVFDLKSDEGTEALRRLVARSDVFVQALRPGTAARLGFGYEAVKALRPDVIYVSLSAFGPEGPLSELPGFDPLMQAFTGIMSLTGDPDGAPARVGGSVIDFGTGMWGAVAVLTALRERDRTGNGTHIDLALMDTALTWVSYHHMGYLATGRVPHRMGSALGSIAPYEAFPTSDGHLMISAANDGIFRRMCQALDTEALTEDTRFRTNPDRVENRSALFDELSVATAGHTTADLWRLLSDHNVPCSPIQDSAQVVDHPQVVESGMMPPVEGTRYEGYRDVSLPMRFDGARPRSERPPPAAGEHTDEVLRELGLGGD